MSDTSQTPYTPAEAAFAARVSKEAGAEAVFVFAYNLTFDNAYTDGLAAIAGSALYCVRPRRANRRAGRSLGGRRCKF